MCVTNEVPQEDEKQEAMPHEGATARREKFESDVLKRIITLEKKYILYVAQLKGLPTEAQVQHLERRDVLEFRLRHLNESFARIRELDLDAWLHEWQNVQTTLLEAEEAFNRVS